MDGEARERAEDCRHRPAERRGGDAPPDDVGDQAVDEKSRRDPGERAGDPGDPLVHASLRGRADEGGDLLVEDRRRRRDGDKRRDRGHPGDCEARQGHRRRWGG